MRRLLGTGAVVLGMVGVLVSVAAVGIGWWAAFRTGDRIVRLCTRVENGLGEADTHLIRVERRMDAIRSDLTAVRVAAETIDRETQDLPRVRERIEELLDRLVPILDRVDATTDSLRTVAAGLRTLADVVDQFNGNLEVSARVRNAVDKIDHAAESLNGLRSRVDDLKSAKVIQLTREFVTLVQDAIASSERLAEGLASVRQGIADVRARITSRRDNLTFWTYVAATAYTLLWLWNGLGQLCLISWGRKSIHGFAKKSRMDHDATAGITI